MSKSIPGSREEKGQVQTELIQFFSITLFSNWYYMYKLTKDNFLEYDVNNLNPGGFVNQDKWKETIMMLDDIKAILDFEWIAISSNNMIPKTLKKEVENFVDQFISKVDDFLSIHSPDEGTLAVRKAAKLEEIRKWHKECMNIHGQNTGFLNLFAIIKTFQSDLNDNENHGNKDHMANEARMMNDLLTKASESNRSIQTILKEIQAKSLELPVDEYSQLFFDKSKENLDASNVWLSVGIILIVSFLVLVFGCNIQERIPTMIDNSKLNVDNLIVKVICLAVYIFMISFSMKQFSINRHLATLNEHRGNGFKSFKLFTESINKEDTATKNQLILHLSKVIYEQNSTGYLGGKNSEINSSIVEITKMIKGDAK